MVLAETGFGKSTSIDGDEELGIKGLSPSDTYVLSVTSKPLPSKGSMKKWPSTKNFNTASVASDLKNYRRIISNKPSTIAHAINLLGRVTTIKNIVLDDANYLMQDMYMENALAGGWDTPKMIGFQFNKIFKAMEDLPEEKNFIMMAHFEEYDKVAGKKGVRMKTTGKMVQEYITPEGKFDVLLIGSSIFDEKEQKASKKFVTRDDGVFVTAKSHRIFGPDETYITNDMAYVIEKVNAYYGNE